MKRNQVILFDSYEKAFMGISIRDKIVKPVEFGGDMEFQNLKEIQDEYYDLMFKRNPHKSKVLQMFLLFDNLTLVDSIAGYDFTTLKETGLIDIQNIENQEQLLGQIQWTRETIDYALCLKSQIISAVVKDFNRNAEKEQLKEYNLTLRQFFSSLFDLSFKNYNEIKNDVNVNKAIDYIESYSTKYYNQYENLWTKWNFEKNEAIDYLNNVWGMYVIMETARYMMLLEMSSNQSAVLLQNKYKFSVNKLELDNQSKSIFESYRILRISYKEIIGALPKLESIEDVLRIKDKRYRDIKRLREVINSVESSLRDGKNNALIKAKKELTLATKDLNRGLTYSKVGNWATYLSLPISIIETLIGIPPIGGFSSSIVSASATFKSEEIKKRNNWIQVIR